MITCKEDLAGKYALRADTEVFSLFMDKCEEFGIVWLNGDKPKSFIADMECVGVDNRLELSQQDVVHLDEDNLNYVKVCMEDFVACAQTKQPSSTKTKVDYVLVDWNSYSELFIMLENNVELYGVGEEYFKLDLVKLVYRINEGFNIYKKVVSELTWKDSLKEYLEQPSAAVSEIPSGFVSMSLFGEEWSLSEGEFLDLCKVVVNSLGEDV